MFAIALFRIITYSLLNMFIFNGANVAAHNIKLHQTAHQRYIYLFGTISASPASVAVLVQALRRTNAHCTNIVRFICLGQLWFRLEDVTVALRRTNAKCTNTVYFSVSHYFGWEK